MIDKGRRMTSELLKLEKVINKSKNKQVIKQFGLFVTSMHAWTHELDANLKILIRIEKMKAKKK
jgi:hypothetical protein